MMYRRLLLGSALAGPAFCEASAQPYDANGLDRRPLSNVEDKWIKTRFIIDDWMETGRLKPRDT